MKQTIVFFGSGDYTLPVIEKLSNHNLVLVVSNEKNGKLSLFCDIHSILYITSQLKESEVIEKIKKLNPTVAVLASYGAFVPDAVINTFPNGIINIHPSLLPLYKGPSPIQYTLLNGDPQTGVTLIKLDSEIDHGPILSQKPYTLSGNETTEDLLSILFEIGAGMVEEQIIKLEQEKPLVETPQDHSKETWSYKIEKKDGMIDLKKPPAKGKLENKIRAFYPWPGVWFKARLKDQDKLVKLLPEGKIQVEGKNAMNFKDFVNGFGEEGQEILKRLELY